MVNAFQILLVEDDPHDVLLVIEALEDFSQHAVRAVEDGVEALRYLHGGYTDFNDRLPDLIFLDLKLPKMSGHAFLAQLKANPALRHIPVIVLSNSALSQDIQKSYALYANCYVQKPLDPLEFKQMIRQLIDFWFNTATLPSA